MPLPEATWPVNGRSASSSPGLCPPHNSSTPPTLLLKPSRQVSRYPRKCPITISTQTTTTKLHSNVNQVLPMSPSTRCHLFTGIISFNLPNNQMRLLLLLLLILMGKLGMERRSNLPKVSQPASSQVTV